MGESSFWYRPTRVVPDQRPLNGRCCCCCIVTTLIYLPLQYLWFILYVPFWSDNVIFVWRLWHSSSIDVAGIARPQRPEQLVSHTRVTRLVAWHSGRTSVSGRRTFPVLRSTCSWWVTTNTTNEIQESTGQLQKYRNLQDHWDHWYKAKFNKTLITQAHTRSRFMAITRDNLLWTSKECQHFAGAKFSLPKCSCWQPQKHSY